ncbi:MAG TPA: pinensin family lanthipeptide [Luteibaculaceae bacterium]|nr:pinensin family lanthipeptide [Luteibaculaceae bacterium]
MKKRLPLNDLKVKSFVTSVEAHHSAQILGAGTQLNPCGIRNTTRMGCESLDLNTCQLDSLELRCPRQSLQVTCPD